MDSREAGEHPNPPGLQGVILQGGWHPKTWHRAGGHEKDQVLSVASCRAPHP